MNLKTIGFYRENLWVCKMQRNWKNKVVCHWHSEDETFSNNWHQTPEFVPVDYAKLHIFNHPDNDLHSIKS